MRYTVHKLGKSNPIRKASMGYRETGLDYVVLDSDRSGIARAYCFSQKEADEVRQGLELLNAVNNIVGK